MDSMENNPVDRGEEQASGGRVDREPQSCGRCQYCGAELNPNYYFCPHCATPYKHLRKVLPRSHPPYLSTGDRVEKKAPHVKPVFWTYFSVIVAASIAGFILHRSGRADLGFYVQSIAMLVTTCLVGVRYWRSLAVQLGRFGFSQLAGWGGLLLLLPCLVFNYGYHKFLIEYLGAPVSPMMQFVQDGGLGPAGTVVVVCIVPALTEEIAFRGLIQHWLQVALRPWKAIAIAAALFTLLHFSVLSAPYIFLLGLLLGWSKWRTGSLYPAIVIHFIHNFIVVAYLWPLG